MAFRRRNEMKWNAYKRERDIKMDEDAIHYHASKQKNTFFIVLIIQKNKVYIFGLENHKTHTHNKKEYIKIIIERGSIISTCGE